jgi:hypothetical protein
MTVLVWASSNLPDWLNAELESMWKEVVVSKLRYYPKVCPEGLRETTKNVIWDNQCPGKDLN